MDEVWDASLKLLVEGYIPAYDDDEHNPGGFIVFVHPQFPSKIDIKKHLPKRTKK
jgi:hypothetical protein